MHFVLLALAAVVAIEDVQQDERLKKYLDVKPSSRFRPIHLLEDLPEKPVPKLIDYMGLTEAKVVNENDEFST